MDLYRLRSRYALISLSLGLLVRLATITRQLQKAALELMATRPDTRLQFPSLLRAWEELVPRQQWIFDAFALNETAKLEMQHRQQFQRYPLLLQARYRRSVIISNVHMLIACRLGLYGMQTAASQERDIELHLADLNNNFALAKKSASRQTQGF